MCVCWARKAIKYLRICLQVVLHTRASIHSCIADRFRLLKLKVVYYSRDRYIKYIAHKCVVIFVNRNNYVLRQWQFDMFHFYWLMHCSRFIGKYIFAFFSVLICLRLNLNWSKWYIQIVIWFIKCLISLKLLHIFLMLKFTYEYVQFDVLELSNKNGWVQIVEVDFETL